MPGWNSVRSVANKVTGTIVATQVAAAVGITIAGTVRRRNRQPRRFPVTTPRTASAGPDEVTIYTFGEDLFRDMLAAIDHASSTIYFETYIWKGDQIGRRFKAALTAAAERGVAVYVIYDEFANLVVPRPFFRLSPRIKVRRWPIVSSPMVWNHRNSGRDHRKILVVDSEVAFLGGYNVGEDYRYRWRDTHARFVGPSVAEIENAFVEQWNSRPVGTFSTRQSHVELTPPNERAWPSSIRIHRNTPRHAVYPIRNMYLEAIDRAASRIWLTQAYLIPDDDLVAALFAAAKRGVDVRIIVPEESNHVLADWLSRGYYDRLLTAGVRLFLYQVAMVHAKTATVDGEWSTIGTANLDRLSLLGNYEINAEIVSPTVATAMEEIFEVDLENCRELTRDEWSQRSLVAKATEEVLSPWRPLL